MLDVVAGVKAAYERAPAAWGSGPERVYQALAEALVAASSVPLGGSVALDLGTGTGVAAGALGRAGARTVGLDLALAMLQRHASTRPPGVAGDIGALPFRAGVFDAVVAAFSINHVPDAQRALRGITRICRPGAVFLASTFSSERQHPARVAVELVLSASGFIRPAWFVAFKEQLEPAVGTASALAATAQSAGLVDVEVRAVDVDTGVDSAEAIADWRLGMAQYVEFLADLEPARRTALRDAAVEAVQDQVTPIVPVLFLLARVR